MKTILSTKKLSLHQKEKIKKAGYLLVEKKFIKTKKVVFSITITNEFLIFTSKKAVKSILHIKKQLVTNKVFCVGEKTKKYLEKKGFHVVEYKDYAEELAQVIVSKYTTTSFVFFCGNIRRDTLPKKLTENKIELKEVVVYQTTLKPHIINNTFDAIMFFSPSGIKSYII